MTGSSYNPMIYALKADYESYTGTATADLPDEINRKLDRAEELIQASIRGKGNPQQEELDADASSGQADISVLDASVFDEDDGVTIEDDDNSETGTIDSITEEDKGSDTITLDSNLTNSYSQSARAYIRVTNPDDRFLRQRIALRKATCAQVEYWEEAFSENYDIAGSVKNFSIGSLQMSFASMGSGGSVLSQRTYRHLLNAGLLYAGVGNDSSVTQDFIANDPRVGS